MYGWFRSDFVNGRLNRERQRIRNKMPFFPGSLETKLSGAACQEKEKAEINATDTCSYIGVFQYSWIREIQRLLFPFSANMWTAENMFFFVLSCPDCSV